MAKKPTKHKLRVPRLNGLTQLCRAYNLLPIDSQQRKTLKKKVIGIILDNYINNGFTVLGFPTTIPELSSMFDIPIREVYAGITRTARRMGDMVNDKEGLKETYGALLAMTLNNSMAITGTARYQTESLLRAKGHRLWVPGLDRDLSASLAVESKNNTNLLALIKHLSGRDGNSTTIDITNQSMVQNQNHAGNYIGPNEAIAMIDQGTQPLLESGTELKRLGDEYGTDNLPEIIATKQIGLKDDGTFTKADKAKLEDHTDDRRGDIEEG